MIFLFSTTFFKYVISEFLFLNIFIKVLISSYNFFFIILLLLCWETLSYYWIKKQLIHNDKLPLVDTLNNAESLCTRQSCNNWRNLELHHFVWILQWEVKIDLLGVPICLHEILICIINFKFIDSYLDVEEYLIFSIWFFLSYIYLT